MAVATGGRSQTSVQIFEAQQLAHHQESLSLDITAYPDVTSGYRVLEKLPKRPRRRRRLPDLDYQAAPQAPSDRLVTESIGTEELSAPAVFVNQLSSNRTPSKTHVNTSEAHEKEVNGSVKRDSVNQSGLESKRSFEKLQVTAIEKLQSQIN